MSYILDALRRADAQRTRDLLPGAAASTTRVVFADTQPYRRGLPWPAIAIACALLLAGFVAWHFWPAATPASPSPALQPAAPAAATPVVMQQPATPAIAQQAATAPVAAAAPAPSPAAASASAPARVEAAAPPRADTRAVTLDELPATLRAELPKLAITGSAYSDNAAHRLLIINGQVLHEKDEVAAGVVLEQIQPRAAVLRYKGQRFQLSY